MERPSEICRLLLQWTHLETLMHLVGFTIEMNTLAQYTFHYLAFVKAVVNLRVPRLEGIS